MLTTASAASTDGARKPSIVVGTLSAYLVARAWQLAMIGRPVLTPDTDGYRAPGAGWLSLAQTSFAGHRTRPWPVTILYALGGSDEARVLLQFAVATVAWAALLAVIATGPLPRWARIASAVAITTFALSPGVAAWDVVLLAESASTSLTALVLVGLLLVVRPGRFVAGLAVLTPALGLLVVVRPVFVPFALLVAAAVLWWGRLMGALRFAGIAAATLAVATLYTVWYNGNVDLAWGRDAGQLGLRARTVQQYAILAYSPSGPEFTTAAAATGDASSCIRADPPEEPSAWDWWHARLVDCPDGITWISDHFPRWFAEYLVRHPAAARRYLREATAESAVQRVDGLTQLPSPVPEPLTEFFFSTTRGVDPIVGWTTLAAGLAAAVVTRRRHRRTLRQARSRVAALVVALVGAVLAVVATAFASALDLSRVGLSATVLWRLAVVLLVVQLAVLLVDGRHDAEADTLT